MFDWSFQLGSCAMKAFPFYLYSFQIFSTMESRPADFMLWMGDHVYMLKPWQWNSKDAMINAYANQRSQLKLESFMKSRPQYAIWDDHDYGPNNAGAEFFNKKTARLVFKEMWTNQLQANDSEGIYFSFKHKEAEFFMLDVRYFKIADSQLLGDKQMNWLLKELKKSDAKFKFIVSGVQVLCDGGYENFRKYPVEFSQLMNFISENKIEGILFTSGDVHYTEASCVERTNEYPLYDFTMSPLTSFPINYLSTNYNRIEGTKFNTYNFGEISFSGEESNRCCDIKSLNIRGETLWSFRIFENDLKYKIP